MGAAQPFSKIKLPGSPQKAITSVRRSSGLVGVGKVFRALWSRPRVLVHFAVAAGVIAIIGSSTLNSTGATSLQLKTGGVGSSLDHVATATVAAEIAHTTNFALASDTAKQADALSTQITLPTESDAVLAKSDVVETAGSDRRTIHTYTVAPGDTISTIASHFGVTTSTIKWANDLSDVNDVSPGDQLTILPVSGVLYSVQSGDTAESIASKFQANAAQIISFNNAEAKGLQVGQKIVVPDGVKQEAAPAPVTHARSSAPSLTSYIGAGNGYDFGYCTWYVASRRSVPSNWGNAINWYYNAQFSGFSVGSTPAVGAIAWTSAGYSGHVAYVEAVNGGSVTISEMNYAGWDQVDYRTVPASSFRYIY